jgi:hypothetical protein
MVGKQERWTKLIVDGVDTHQFPESEEGMKSLQTEPETFNEGLGLASTPRYLTHPDKRVEKAYSSLVITMKDKAHSKRLLKHGVIVFGQPRRRAEFFSACPTNQRTKCQQFGHHWLFVFCFYFIHTALTAKYITAPRALANPGEVRDLWEILGDPRKSSYPSHQTTL